MMCSRPLSLAILLIALRVGAADAEQSTVAEGVLNNRLNNLESQAIQRQGRSQSVLDLLNRQDSRLAGQALNTLKTRSPRNTAIPLLDRKLDRSRRPVGTFGRR